MRVRDKYLLIMAVVWGPCLTLAAASYALVLRPQMEHRRQLETKVAQAKEHYARAVEAAKPELQARLTEQVGYLHDRIADFLTESEDAPQLAFDVATLAQETRLESFEIKPVSTRASTESSDCVQITETCFHVSFLASYARFAAFLNALERRHPVIFVKTFTIDRALEAEAQPQIEMELAVLVERPQGI
ncbi:MAG TPA: hypothetical protein PKH24_13950 [Sedimentisphaerales bacterium]|jgi:Tfp pilus assembly protein PilO|nr:hypothetical protein [Sedimentisphaerales bacterium]HNU28380.1 hypothetical protein [Sedimentisphaerales bacterium]